MKKLAVIIPTLNEGKYIHHLLQSLSRHKQCLEIIVVDGGSQDDTKERVRPFPFVRLLETPRGRGIQMHYGATQAHCEYLLFIHADTSLPAQFVDEVLSTLDRDEVSGGSFCMQFDENNAWLKVYAAFTKINHILFTYGDQGLFLKKSLYDALGGFQPMPLMEDIEFQKRIRNAGRFVKIRKPVITSARRYHKNGYVIHQMKNNLIVLMYYLGWPVKKLKSMYREDIR